MTPLDKANRDIKWNMILRSTEKVASAEFAGIILPELKAMLHQNEKLFEEVCSYQARVIAAAKGEAARTAAMRWLTEVEESVEYVRQIVSARIEQLDQGDNRRMAGGSAHPISVSLAAPTGLGTFDGTHSMWPAFRDLFIALVDSREYTSLNKLLYLKGACIGAAALAISGYDPLEDCYEAAWEALKWIYDDEYAVAQSIIDRLFDMKPAESGGSNELRRIVDTTTSSLRQLSNLKLRVAIIVDAIIVNLVARKLPQSIVANWEQQRKREHTPTLKELLNFLDAMSRARIFEASEVPSSSTASRGARLNTSRSSRLLTSYQRGRNIYGNRALGQGAWQSFHEPSRRGMIDQNVRQNVLPR